MSKKPPLEVVCAVIIEKTETGNKVFAARRSSTMTHPQQWEFPGGKIEHYETAEDAVVREILEEFNTTIEPIQKLTPVVHHYPHRSICLIPLLCRVVSGSLTPLEHDQSCWCTKEGLFTLHWCEADMPIVEAISTMLFATTNPLSTPQKSA